MVMSFGRFKGRDVSDLPDHYLLWLLVWGPPARVRGLWAEARPAVLAEVAARGLLDDLARRGVLDAAIRAEAEARGLLRSAERDARHFLAEVVELGWRAAARRHHPDVGGSAQAMREVLRARDRLRQLVEAG